MSQNTFMKRDMDLIRLIMLELEGGPKVDKSKYTEQQIAFHQMLLLDAEFAVGTPQSKTNPNRVHLDRLTWNGCEFLDKIRGDSAWNKMKSLLQEKGLEVAFDTIKDAFSSLVGGLLR